MPGPIHCIIHLACSAPAHIAYSAAADHMPQRLSIGYPVLGGRQTQLCAASAHASLLRTLLHALVAIARSDIRVTASGWAAAHTETHHESGTVGCSCLQLTRQRAINAQICPLHCGIHAAAAGAAHHGHMWCAEFACTSCTPLIAASGANVQLPVHRAAAPSAARSQRLRRRALRGAVEPVNVAQQLRRGRALRGAA